MDFKNEFENKMGIIIPEVGGKSYFLKKDTGD
jgi:hypothetical protein